MRTLPKAILTATLFLTFTIAAQAQTFTLSSSNLGGQATQAEFFNGFGCTGENLSPQLSWEHAPEGTKSFAITMHDVDAPTGSGWWHWLAFDIPTSTTSLAAGAGSTNPSAMPKGVVQSITDYGKPGYGGPCPPEGHGFHRYEITLFALGVESLGLEASANPALVGYYIGANTIQKSSIVFYAKR